MTKSSDVASTFDDHPCRVICVAMTADEIRLVSASEDGTVKLWDVDSCLQVGTSIKQHMS